MKAGNCARQMKIFPVLKTPEKDDEAKFATLPGLFNSPWKPCMRMLFSYTNVFNFPCTSLVIHALRPSALPWIYVYLQDRAAFLRE